MKLIRQDLFGEARGLEREPAIVWGPEVKPAFISRMRQNGKDERYIKICVSYLDRFVTEPIRVLNPCLTFSSRGRGLAWTRMTAWGAGGPGFKSRRPHHPPS